MSIELVVKRLDRSFLKVRKSHMMHGTESIAGAFFRVDTADGDPREVWVNRDEVEDVIRFLENL